MKSGFNVFKPSVNDIVGMVVTMRTILLAPLPILEMRSLICLQHKSTTSPHQHRHTLKNPEPMTGVESIEAGSHKHLFDLLNRPQLTSSTITSHLHNTTCNLCSSVDLIFRTNDRHFHFQKDPDLKSWLRRNRK